MTMTTVHNGDIFNAPGIIVHGCNAQGVMGSGFAAEARRRHPELFDAYTRQIAASSDPLGTISYIRSKAIAFGDTVDQIIVNGITQRYYGRDPNRRYVDYAAVSKVFEEVLYLAQKLCMQINFPKIGAGLANGDWGVIEQLIEFQLLDQVDVEGNEIKYVLWTID